MSTIALIEDDIELSTLLEAYLNQAGYRVLSTPSPKVGVELIKNELIDLAILDLTLPEIDGVRLCKELRALRPNLPIIISTARGDISTKIQVFNIGADDFIAKPYDPAELLARIHARLKHTVAKEIYELGTLCINAETRSVVYEGRDIALTNAEFDILYLLAKNANKPASREVIANSISNISYDSSLRSIDTHIRNLRVKLGCDKKNNKLIVSVWGIGYKLCPPQG